MTGKKERIASNNVKADGTPEPLSAVTGCDKSFVMRLHSGRIDLLTLAESVHAVIYYSYCTNGDALDVAG